MTITEFLDQMAARFPRYAGEISAWAGSYNRALGHLLPRDLQHCWESVVDRWDGGGFPKPKAFAEYAPLKSNQPFKSSDYQQKCENRRAEIRGLVHRTFERYTVEIGQLAASYENEPCNAYRASVAAYVEREGRNSAWYASMTNAPAYQELDEQAWQQIQIICDTSAPMIYGRKKFSLGREDPEQESMRQRSIERAYSGEAA